MAPTDGGTGGAHLRAGVAIAGTLDEARQRLADMASIGLDADR